LMAQLPPDSQAATASQFTLSAFAVAVDKANGATTSAPPIMAVLRVLRTFFNGIPFDVRVPIASPPMWAAGAYLRRGVFVGRAISVRHDSEGRLCPAGMHPAAAAGDDFSRAFGSPLTRGIVLLKLLAPLRDHEDDTRPDPVSSIHEGDYIRQITERSRHT